MLLQKLDQVSEGTRLAQPLVGKRGRLLLAKNVALTGTYINLLRNVGMTSVYIADADTADVEPPHPISFEDRARTLARVADAFDRIAEAGEQIRKIPADRLRREMAGSDSIKALIADGAGEALCALTGDMENLAKGMEGHDVLTGLNSIKSHDAYTFMHSLDVTIMGLVLGQAAGLRGPTLRTLGVGCLLHDLGKVLIQPELLNKTGKLTEEEFDQLKMHPVTGYELMRAIAPRLGSLVPAVAYQHHERQDGSGYPRGIKGNPQLGVNEPGRIHDFGALCAVADIYDAMSSHRPYRRARPIDEVVATIASYSGTHLNAEAVRLFLAAVTPYPVCSEVRIKTGAYANYTGIVTDVPKRDLRRPKVRILFDPTGQRTDAKEIDLSVDRDIEIESKRDDKELPTSMGAPDPVLEKKPAPRRLPKSVLAALKRAV